jgi:ABC-type branched-subunit amino acid transport system substrate-binding protein
VDKRHSSSPFCKLSNSYRILTPKPLLPDTIYSVFRLFFFISIFLGIAYAQPYKIGVILSQTGRASQVGQSQARALDVLEAQLRQSVFGRNIELVVRDDASLPANTLREAQNLVENEDVIALVCCNTLTQSETISDYVQTQSILTIAMSDIPESDSPNSNWLFTVKPNTQRYLQSVILQLSRKGQQSIGVMTLDNEVGDTVQNALEMLITPGGMQVAVLQRYRPNVTVLTPEALWVATRQPESILVWGLPQDSLLAYTSLRKRGFEREIIMNPALLDGVSVPTLYNDAVFPMPAVSVARTLPDTQPNYLEAFRFATAMATNYGPNSVTYQGAYAYDAVMLIEGALEQALTFGIPLDNTATIRRAMRDALIGMPSFKGGAAVYDYRDGDAIGVDPYSLVLAKVVNGVLVPLQ